MVSAGQSGVGAPAGRVGVRYLTLRERCCALLLYVPFLYGLHVVVTGRFVVDLSGSELWLVSGLGFLVYSLLDAPFFVPPRQALASSVTVGLILLSINLDHAGDLRPALAALRWAAVGLTVCAVVVATVAILQYKRQDAASGAANELAKVLGDGRVLFTPPALISVVGFHQGSVREILWLAFGWMLFVLVRPIELVWTALKRLASIAKVPAAGEAVGRIERIDSPDILRVSLDAPRSWERGKVLVACLPDSRQVYVIALSKHSRDDGVLGTGIIPDRPAPFLVGAETSGVYKPSDPPQAESLLAELSGVTGDEEAPLVGFVVEESTIASLQLEVAADVDLREGMLLFCRQRSQRVFYQLLAARTREESFSNNPFGTHRATAMQLGILDPEKGFVKYPWLPDMNCPVFLASGLRPPAEAPDDAHLVLGTVPGTGVRVRARFSDLVEYHTAVLGVTGTGKTEFVFDVIRHGLEIGAKIFCVDLTEEYRERLDDLGPSLLGFDAEQMARLEELILGVETGTYSAGEEKKQLDDWIRTTRPEIQTRVDAFLRSETGNLGVFELPEIANTRATLRATELYLSAIFAWARQQRPENRILIVLEEAHTVVPEFNLYPRDRADTHAVVGRMAQIALQGRKYGVGLLLISQRTALVSKTLLSQCNTCLSFAMYDKTGLDYLRDIYGDEHVAAIPNLGFLQGVAFGKAVLSDRPILFEIPYDQAKKQASTARRRRPPLPPDTTTIEDAPDTTGAQDVDDDIPF